MRAMSLYSTVGYINDRERSDCPFLPVASDATTSAANKQVEQEMASTCIYDKAEREDLTRTTQYMACHNKTLIFGRQVVGFE